MEYKNSSRLSIMERRLDDVMKSNLSLQTTLQSVLLKFTNVPGEGGGLEKTDSDPNAEDTSPDKQRQFDMEDCIDIGDGSSKKWWDKLDETSDEMKSTEDNPTNINIAGQKSNHRKVKKNFQALSSDDTRKGIASRVSGDDTHARADSQVRVGSRVWLADTLDFERKVARGRVMALGGEGLFHNRRISQQYLRVNLEEVNEDIPLMVPVEEADQSILRDALGSTVLWFKGLTFLDK
ncbi:hypothetical protein M758_UG227200 [Ceratodon purpureus]|nr:hypothetical protein M758_UG227200 [Ceratodon purpureus]